MKKYKEIKTTPQQEEKIKNIMLFLLNKNVLKFMNLPHQYNGFQKFRESLSKENIALLQELQEINSEIMEFFWAKDPQIKELFMAAIPNIYNELKSQARLVLQNLQRKITAVSLDEAMDYLLIQVHQNIDEVLTDKNISGIIPENLFDAISNFPLYLKLLPELAGIFESHIGKLLKFVSFFSGNVSDFKLTNSSETNFNEEDVANEDQDEEDEECKSINSLSFSSCNSSTNVQTTESNNNPGTILNITVSNNSNSLFVRPGTPSPSAFFNKGPSSGGGF